MAGLLQPGRVGVIVLMLELFLQLALFFGRLSGVVGRGRRVEIDLLVHVSSSDR